MSRAAKTKIRVLLVEDHPLTRQGLRKLLQASGSFEIVGESGDGELAVTMAKELVPDVAVVDTSLSRLGSVEVTRRIKATSPMVSVLALTAENGENHVEAMLQAGASGYLLKTAREDSLTQAIRAILAGECVLDRQLILKLLRHGGNHAGSGHPPALAQRDVRILMLIAEGLTNEDIAQRLAVSVRTVKLYISAIFGKLGTNSRTTAVVQALRDGVIRFEDLSI